MPAFTLASIEPARQRYWDVRAAANFMAGGAGAGLLVYAAAVPDEPVLAGSLGLALICAGLLCVWLEIGRPWRALNVLRRAGSSWMSRESLLFLALLASVPAALGSPSRLLLGLSAGLALAYLYAQARMLQAARGIPAWRLPLSIPLMVCTGLTEGWGLGLLLAWLPGQSGAVAPVAWVLLALIILRALAFAAYRAGLTRAGAPRAAVAVLAQAGPVFFSLSVLSGALALSWTLAPRLIALLAAAGVLSAALGWWLKYTLVIRAAYNQGFGLPRTPVRGQGVSRAGARPGW